MANTESKTDSRNVKIDTLDNSNVAKEVKIIHSSNNTVLVRNKSNTKH